MFKSSPLMCTLILLLALVEFVPARERQAVRIMPLGDSITWDITFGDTRPDGLRTGYRQPLWLALQAEGFDVDFVGSLVAGQDAVPAFDPDNEGHPGWTDAQIAANIYNWLTLNPADVILLHIGTNGLDSSPSDVANILNEVDRFEADHDLTITVFVARIIQRVPYSSTTTQFNDNVETMVAQRVLNQGDRLVSVDMEDGAGLIYEIDTSAQVGDMYDYLHPNSKGYAKMAAEWFSHLQPFLRAGNCPAHTIHHWRLDETAGALYDDDVAGADATCSICPTPGAGIIGGAQEFAAGNQVTVAADASFDWAPSGSFSVELWCRPNATAAAGLLGRQGNGAFTAWSLGISPAGKAALHLEDSGNSLDLEAGTALAAGAWQQIAATRDGVSGMTRLFVNGVQADFGSAAFSQGFASTADVTLGFLALEPGSHFLGRLDEIAVCDSVLTPAEIAAHYSAGLGGLGSCDGTPAGATINTLPVTTGHVGDAYSYDVNAGGNPSPRYRLQSAVGGMTIDSVSGLITWTPIGAGSFNTSVIAANYFGADTQSFAITVTHSPSCPPQLLHYWTLDESSGANYTDQIGSTAATCSNCPEAVPGIVNVAKQFDRINDAVSVDNDGSLSWGAAESYTFEFWMNKGTGCAGTAQANNEVVIGRAGAGWWIGIMCEAGGNVGRLRCYFQGTDIYSTMSLTDGEWHHIVFVRDNTAGAWRLYIDGVLNRNVSGSGLNLTASDVLTLGWFNGPDPGKYRFGGVLDEVAIYDAALPALVIEQHYNLGMGATYCFTCGDIDANGSVTISDAVYLINFIFAGGAPPLSSTAADVDCSGFVTISDAVYLITYIFAGGAGPCAACP